MTYPITIKKTTDGQLPKYTSKHPDGHRAVIDSVTGTVANGETLTINGHFSAKRNGDLFSLISRATDSGESVFPTYHHTQDESFLGSGSSIVWVTHDPVGSGLRQIEIGLLDEIYCSHLYKIALTNYGVNADGPQIKLTRFLKDDHSSDLATTIFIYGEGTTLAGAGLSAGICGSPNGTVHSGFAASVFDNWVRTWTYLKKNETGRWNGSTFYCHKNEGTKECAFNWNGGRHANDYRVPAGTVLTPFFTPKYFSPPFTEEYYSTISGEPLLNGPNLSLPFYIKGGIEGNVYIDGLIVNDSPESVWLVDSADVDASMATGKAVHLPQLSRNTETIQAECWLGDFTASDNIYLTTFNQDGKYATPVLVRSAA